MKKVWHEWATRPIREQTFTNPIRIDPALADQVRALLTQKGFNFTVEPTTEIGGTSFIVEPVPATLAGFSEIEKELRRAGISFSR